MQIKHAKKLPKRRFWILNTFLSVILFVGVLGFLLLDNINETVNNSVIYTDNLSVTTLTSEEVELLPSDLYTGESLNILVMGIDSRMDQDEAIISKDDADETIRSDTTLLVNITKDRDIVNVISIPRDIWMKLPDCRKSDGRIIFGDNGQFNWSFSMAAETDDLPAGIACTERTVEGMMKNNVNGFVVVDFTGFSKIIETLGGLDICIEEPISEHKYLGLEIPAGCQTLDPITATQYARVRYIKDGSDMGRIQRQQQIIQAIIKQVLENKISNLPTMFNFLQTSLETIRISPIFSDIKADVGLALSIQEAEIRFMTMPVQVAEFDPNRLVLKEPQNSLFWEAINNETTLPDGVIYSVKGNFYKMIEGEAVQIEAPEPYILVE